MRDSKRTAKEQNIILAAEKVFAEMGFRNAKMEDVASLAGITKVTLYSYFKSKENLYMAITYKALMLLLDQYYKTIEAYKGKPGIDSTMALSEIFMSFCRNNYLYSEALLDYFSMVRSTSLGKDQTKLTEALKESIYYNKLQDVHNIVFKLTTKEIERGQKDGSIVSTLDPMLMTLNGWSASIGYIKLLTANGDVSSPLFNVDLQDLKQLKLDMNRSMLTSNDFHINRNKHENIE